MRVGLAQMFIADQLDTNRSAILQQATAAADRGVQLLAYPEMCLTGYNPKTLGQPGFDATLAESLGLIKQRTAELGIGVIVGSAQYAGGKLYNTAVVLLPDGSSHIYRKNSLTAAESKYFTAGDEQLNFCYREKQFGVIICRDQNYPELARQTCPDSTDALFILAAHYYRPAEARWKLLKNQALPIARAVENHCHVLLANAVGSHIGMVSLGHSLIGDPEGDLMKHRPPS
jgi:predicted amidohydrolase